MARAHNLSASEYGVRLAGGGSSQFVRGGRGKGRGIRDSQVGDVVDGRPQECGQPASAEGQRYLHHLIDPVSCVGKRRTTGRITKVGCCRRRDRSGFPFTLLRGIYDIQAGGKTKTGQETAGRGRSRLFAKKATTASPTNEHC